MLDALNTAPLPHDQIQELLRRAQRGDVSALEQLVVHNAALVKSIVKKFLNRGVEYEDLFQIGNLGLIKAIRNYSAAFDVRFSTYAVPMIAGEIKRFLRDDGMVKVSRSLKETATKAAQVREQLYRERGHEPGVQDIAAAMGIRDEELVFALDSARSHVSLNEPVFEEDNGVTLMDRMEETAAEDTRVVDKLLLKELLSSLDSRERKLIFLRYFQDRTQSEIAKVLGVSQVQVSRLESRIMKKLRKEAL